VPFEIIAGHFHSAPGTAIPEHLFQRGPVHRAGVIEVDLETPPCRQLAAIPIEVILRKASRIFPEPRQ
jgi:hypothetical protein